MFADTGLMGENIPIEVTNVTLVAENRTPVDFNWTKVWSAPSVITFPNGNYTVNYTAPLKDFHLQESLSLAVPCCGEPAGKPFGREPPSCRHEPGSECDQVCR